MALVNLIFQTKLAAAMGDGMVLLLDRPGPRMIRSGMLLDIFGAIAIWIIVRVFFQ